MTTNKMTTITIKTPTSMQITPKQHKQATQNNPKQHKQTTQNNPKPPQPQPQFSFPNTKQINKNTN